MYELIKDWVATNNNDYCVTTSVISQVTISGMFLAFAFSLTRVTAVRMVALMQLHSEKCETAFLQHWFWLTLLDVHQ